MKRTLIVCNTYYQLIISVQMRLTVKSSEAVSVIISDQSNGAHRIYENLKKIGLFENVYYFSPKSDAMKRSRTLNRLYYFYGGLFGCRYGVLDKKIKFDEIVAYNLDLPTYNIYAALKRKNRALKCNYMEEGAFSYFGFPANSRLMDLIGKIREKLGMGDLRKKLEYFYCYYPELYTGELTPVKVDTIGENSEIVNTLKKVFGIEKEKLSYSEKYIFFTSVLDFEGGEPVHEFEIVKKVAELVGKDNLLVKKHPRDKRTVYEDNGFKVDKNSSVPWEVLQFFVDVSEKTLLTVNSGSVISTNLMLKNGAKTYFMYKICDIENNTLAVSFVRSFDKLMDRTGKLGMVMDKVRIAESLDDILK